MNNWIWTNEMYVLCFLYSCKNAQSRLSARIGSIINFICIHLTNNLNACLKYNNLFIDLSTMMFYIYSQRCYLQTCCISAIRKIVYLKIFFPLQSKFYSRNCPIATHLKKLKYILYCLNLNTDLEQGQDEDIAKVTVTNKPPNCFAPPFSTFESYKIDFPTYILFQLDTS